MSKIRFQQSGVLAFEQDPMRFCAFAVLPLYTADNVSELLKISIDTVIRAAKRGEIPYTNFGRGTKELRRFSLQDIVAYTFSKQKKSSLFKDVFQKLTGLSEIEDNKTNLNAANQPRKGG